MRLGKITDADYVIIIKMIYSIPFDISCLRLIDQKHSNPTKSISNSNEPIRHPIKPRTMTQASVPSAESTFLDTPFDGDSTMIPQCKILIMHSRK